MQHMVHDDEPSFSGRSSSSLTNLHIFKYFYVTTDDWSLVKLHQTLYENMAPYINACWIQVRHVLVVFLLLEGALHLGTNTLISQNSRECIVYRCIAHFT